MAIDPNIALGIRPVEQPNMLAQMGQMMQLRQMQQGFEEQNALRQAFSQGANLNDPETINRISAINPKLGMELANRASEISSRDIGTLEKKNAFYQDQIKSANTPEHVAKITTAMYNDPILGRSLSAIRPLNETLAAIPTDPKELEEFRRRMSLKSSELFESANAQLQSKTSIQTAHIGAAPGHRQATTAAQRLELDRQGTYSVVPGETIDENGQRIPTFATVNTRTGQLNVPQPSAGTRPPVQTPPPANNLGGGSGAGAPSGTQQTPVNSLTQSLTATTPSPVTLTGQAPTPVQFGPKPTAAQEKSAEKAKVSEEGKKAVASTLDDMFVKYADLVKKGGITDTRSSTLENLSAALGSSEMGQTYGRATGDPAQAIRDSINQQRPLLLQAIKNATGMSAQQMNSNVELQTFLRSATDPKISIQSNIDALNNLSKQFGLGKEFTIPTAEAPKATTNQASGNIVEVDGKRFSFPTPEAAAEFKKKVGK